MAGEAGLFPHHLTLNTMYDDDVTRQALDWAQRFARCVRERDFATGRKLFLSNVHSFGTRTCEARGLDQLHSEQWGPTWVRTEGFDYIDGSLEVQRSDDGNMLVVLGRWQSRGVDDAGQWGRQTPYARAGRCTFVLLRQTEGLLCAHTHFSMDPEPA